MPPIPLVDLHTLSSKITDDLNFKNRLKANPNYQQHTFNYIFHSTSNNPFCPRALLECEYIIKKMYQLHDYEKPEYKFK